MLLKGSGLKSMSELPDKCLVHMKNNTTINMDNDIHKFCLSWICVRATNTGTALCISWNDHSIPSMI